MAEELIKKAKTAGCKIIVCISSDLAETPMPKKAIHIPLKGLDQEWIAALIGCDDSEIMAIITSVSGGNPYVAKMLYVTNIQLPSDMTIEEYFLMRYMKLKRDGVI